MEQTRGLDQRCPPSPAIYCLAVRDALAATQGICAGWMEGASVVAYVDDTYLVGSPAAVIAGMGAFGHETRGLVLAVHLRNSSLYKKMHAMRNAAQAAVGWILFGEHACGCHALQGNPFRRLWASRHAP